MQYTPFTIPLVIAGLLVSGVAIYSWPYRRTRSALPFALMAAAIALWTVGYAIQISVVELSAKIFWANIEYLGICTIPITWLLFTMDFTSGKRWLSSGQITLLCIVPAITIVLTWTDGLHGLVRTHTGVRDAGGFVLAVVEYGPWFWVHTIFSYTLHVTGTVMIARFLMRSPPLYKRQALLILTGVLVPTFLNVIYLLKLSPFPNLDLTPFGFIIMGFGSFWALRQFRLFDIVPYARDTIIERMTEGVVVLDHQDRIIDINPSARSIFGCADDNVIGWTAQRACPELLTERFDGIEEVTRGEGFERRFFEVETLPLEDRMENTRGKLIVLREITQRKRAEEEQIRTQRLAAVGELSAGISHNLNNILTGILAPADLLLEENQTESHRRDLERIVAAAIRARDLVRRLRSTAKLSDTTEIVEVDVCDTIEEAIVAAKPRLKDEPESRGVQVKVATNLLDVPTVQGTRLGLHNVLLNLLFNAVDAIGDRGAITVTTRLQDEQVIIEIQDNGIGMSEDVRKRVFEPFFTTKANVGTGLGLSTAYATIARCGGSIEVSSELGRGTTFQISLPVWKERGEPTPAEPQALPDLKAQPPGRILVVEDDDIIMGLIAPLIRKAGHHVDTADDGEAAMQLIAQHTYDLGIIDLGLPHVSGDRVAMRIKQTNPETITVLITGWDLDENDPRLVPFDFRIWKPIELKQLLNTLNHGLDLKRSQESPAD